MSDKTLGIVPADFVFISNKYIHPKYIKMMRGLRKFMRISARTVALGCHIAPDRYSLFECQYQLMPIKDFIFCEDYIIEQLRDRGRISPNVCQKDKWPAGGRLERAARLAKLSMTPPQILSYYRDYMGMSNLYIAQHVGYSKSHVQRMLSGYTAYRPVYIKVKEFILKKMREYDNNVDFDDYY